MTAQQKAEQEGYDARKAGKKESENPYPVGTTIRSKHVQWFYGWHRRDAVERCNRMMRRRGR